VEEIRGNIWFSKLDKEEKDFVESVARDYIGDIHRGFDKFIREITDDDVKRLFEIKMRRILKFSSKEAEDHLLNLEDEMAEVKNHLENLVDFAIEGKLF